VKIPLRCLFIALMLMGISSITAEIRALWVTPWGITTPEAIDEVINDAVTSGQTDLLVEVRYRSDALYTPNLHFKDYPNNEPRSHVLKDDSFDPLAYVLENAKAKHLRVHAWVVVFNATPTLPSLVEDNYIYKNHYDWITYDAKQKRMNSSEAFGYFVDPGIPAVQDYVLDVLSDLVQNYPELDGLHLDYIRYPSSAWGYHPISQQRYENHRVQYGPLSWNEWRTLQITGFVERCYHRVKEINPRILLSAAVFSDYKAAVRYYAQDWKDWLDKGIIDCIYLMAYSTKYATFVEQLSELKEFEEDERIVVGLRAWDQNNGSLLPSNRRAYHGYTILDIARRISHVREQEFAGIALFNHGGLKLGNAWDELMQMSYTPELLLEIDSRDPQFSIDISPEELGDKFAADIKISPNGRQYILGLLIPHEGIWTWELWDTSDQLLFSCSRHYPKGRVSDVWNGKTQADTCVEAGKYVIRMYPENSNYKYYIPIELRGINQR